MAGISVNSQTWEHFPSPGSGYAHSSCHEYKLFAHVIFAIDLLPLFKYKEV